MQNVESCVGKTVVGSGMIPGLVEIDGPQVDEEVGAQRNLRMLKD